MMNKLTLNIIIILLISNHLISQDYKYSLSLLKIKDVNGLLGLESNYRESEVKLKDYFQDKQNTFFYKAILKLNANSYIWHPNFLMLDANFEYSPNSTSDNFINIPNRTENSNSFLLNFNGLMFSSKKINLSFNYSNSSTNVFRDFGTSISRNNNFIGFGSNYTNEIVPINFYFNNNRTKETEMNSVRYYLFNQTNIGFGLNKSLWDVLENKLKFNFNKNQYEVSSLINNSNEIFELNFDNDFIIEKLNNNSISSSLHIIKQNGSFRQNRIFENIHFQYTLPENFKLNVNYLFNNIFIDTLDSKTNQINVRIDHQLFNSLHSFSSFEYFNSNNNNNIESRNILSLGFEYNKKLSFGNLFLNYELKYDKNYRTSSNPFINILNEEIQFDNLKTVILKLPNINENSINIKNSNNSILYEKGIDYLIIKRGDYFEIQRLPGSKIELNSIVYVDYIALNPSDYDFNMLGNLLYSKLSVFDRIFELYFRVYNYQCNDFIKINKSALNSIFSKIIGINFNYNLLSAQFEYENTQSDILPHNANSIILNYTNSFLRDLLFTISGSYQNYFYFNLNENNELLNSNLRLLYRVNSNSQVNLEFGIIKQNTKLSNSEFFNLRIEYSLFFYKLNLKIAYDYYNRNVVSDFNRFNGFFVSLERRF